MLKVSYSVNGQKIKEEDLSKLEITRKDYIDYAESIKKDFANYDNRHTQ